MGIVWRMTGLSRGFGANGRHCGEGESWYSEDCLSGVPNSSSVEIRSVTVPLLIVAVMWFGLSFGLLLLGYLVVGPGVFGKRADGSLAWWSWVLMGPVIFLLWSLWHVVRLLLREPYCQEVAPGVWLGRRPLADELPAEVTLVLDLVAELPAAAGIHRGREYLCVPVLDTTAPPVEELRELVERLHIHPGAVYIHCAQGRGRSALVAAALVLRRGLASSPQEAVRLLQQARPVVKLTWMQMGRLCELAREGVTA